MPSIEVPAVPDCRTMFSQTLSVFILQWVLAIRILGRTCSFPHCVCSRYQLRDKTISDSICVRRSQTPSCHLGGWVFWKSLSAGREGALTSCRYEIMKVMEYEKYAGKYTNIYKINQIYKMYKTYKIQYIYVYIYIYREREIYIEINIHK